MFNRQRTARAGTTRARHKPWEKIRRTLRREASFVLNRVFPRTRAKPSSIWGGQWQQATADSDAMNASRTGYRTRIASMPRVAKCAPMQSRWPFEARWGLRHFDGVNSIHAKGMIMARSRREFLALGSVGLVGAAIDAYAQTPAGQSPELPPGAPPAFGTASPVGPQVSAATFAEAEKLVDIEMSSEKRAQAASNWRMQMAPVYERRVGPRKVALESNLAPAMQWNPSLPGIAIQHSGRSSRSEFVRSANLDLPLPSNEDDIAFAPVTRLSRWIEGRQLTSVR